MAHSNILATTGFNFSSGPLSLLILQSKRVKVRSNQEIVIDFVDSLPSDKSIISVEKGSYVQIVG